MFGYMTMDITTNAFGKFFCRPRKNILLYIFIERVYDSPVLSRLIVKIRAVSIGFLMLLIRDNWLYNII